MRFPAEDESALLVFSGGRTPTLVRAVRVAGGLLADRRALPMGGRCRRSRARGCGGVCPGLVLQCAVWGVPLSRDRQGAYYAGADRGRMAVQGGALRLPSGNSGLPCRAMAV